MLIIYCDACTLRILQKDMDTGGVVQLDENRYLCSKCVPAREAKPPSGRNSASASGSKAAETQMVHPPSGADARSSRPTIKLLKSGERVSGSSAAPMRQDSAPRSPAAAAVASPSVPRNTGKTNLLFAGAAAGVALIIGGILFFGPSQKTPETRVAAGPSNWENSAPIPARLSASPPDANSKSEPKEKALESEAAAAALAEKEKALPSWMRIAEGAEGAERTSRRGVQEALKLPPPEAQQTIRNETIFCDEAVPLNSTLDGTQGASSWKWVTAPHPAPGGTLAHTFNGVAIGPKQHFFLNASPGLAVGPDDILFAYVYIDPKSPPKAVMLQWQLKGWEHRAYWGEDVIPLGNNFSPSRLPMGPLPKTGEWVRLEVIAAQIGVQTPNEQVVGMSFNQSGGVVYWDKAGVVRVNAVADKTPPTPPALPDTPVAAKPQITSTIAINTSDYQSLAKLSCTQLTGGGDYDKFSNTGGNTKAIWSKATPLNTLTGTFTFPERRYGDGLVIVRSLRHTRPDPCRIALVINGQEIFNGLDPAKDANVFYDHKFAIAPGILRAGPNEIKIVNMEETGKQGSDPVYMVQSLEFFASTSREFPAIVSDFQRAQMKTYEQAFELLQKKDSDVVGRLETIIKMNKSTPAAANVFAAAEKQDKGEPALKLFPAVERALELHVKSMENFRKKPPTDPVKVEKLKMAGTISRVDGSKVFVKSGGIEMSVDISAMPPALFLKALALDESKPQGLGDKAAYLLGQGGIEEAQSVLKKLKKDERPEWTGMFTEYAALERLMKFEAAVQSLDASLKHGKLDTASIVLNSLKKDYPEFLDINKERFDYLVSRLEARKK